VSNVTYPDRGKIQLFFFTVLVVLAYGVAVGVSLRGAGFPASLPDVGDGMVTLLGISHAGYLSAKAVLATDFTAAQRTLIEEHVHLAPDGVMGGDRNQNGKTAEGDDFDAETVVEANYLSNIAPQHHNAFNGSGGLWFELERRIQDVWVEQQGDQVWVFAGCIIGPGEHEAVGPDNDILVPPMFFKIVVREPDRRAGDDPDALDDLPIVLASLFPHQRQAHGEIEDDLVTVDVIEELTGLDFFNELSDPVEAALEDTDTVVSWERLGATG